MRDTIIRALKARIQSYADLLASIDPEQLVAKLDVPRDKSIAEHLWCIVGARESYAKALELGSWQGFSCSMTAFGHGDFHHALSSSGQYLLASVRGVDHWSAAHEELLAAVSEHEVMHEGQIIRHVYGLGHKLPDSWRWA